MAGTSMTSSRSRSSVLAARQKDPVFLSQESATVLLGTDFVIRAATPSYATATEREIDELLSLNVFDAFPDNPDVPDEQSTRRLAESIEESFRTRTTQHMPPIRYDIPDPARPGRFIERRWMIVNTPVLRGDEVIGASVRGHDLTVVDDRLLEVLSGYRDVVAERNTGTRVAREHLELLDTFLAVVDRQEGLEKEVAGLRRALETRPVIDQAKGIIMADRRCGPDEAFEVLKRLSMDSNVRVADVAATIVRLTQQS